MKRLLKAAGWFAALGLMAMSCGDSADESLCDAGSDVFCRCRGTLESGTKRCNDAGDGFGACESPFGECEEIEPQPSDTSSVSGNSPSSSSTTKPMQGELYAVCADGGECDGSLDCSLGFCTQVCESYQDCGAAGDCVQTAEGPLCLPYCMQQSDCEAYGSSLSCGYTDDVLPAFDVVVCNAWGDELFLPPDGYPSNTNCDNDAICNLGFAGTERVCGDAGCADGCHAADDCQGEEATCSSDGTTLGTCSGGGSNGDACPGIAVTMDLATNNYIKIDGDTSTLPPPDEDNGTEGCGEQLAPGEEIIYQVTSSDAATLTILLSPEMTFDTQLYVRGTACGVLTNQIACEDEIGPGKSEILEVPLTAGTPVWIFVDGWDGSSGSFSIELDLAAPT